MKTYSVNCCPPKEITLACKLLCPNGYPMLIKDEKEWTAIARAVNQGIDSHLEAITTRSTFEPLTGKCLVHPEELGTLLRRFSESDDEVAWSLRSGILQTLDIEEI